MKRFFGELRDEYDDSEEETFKKLSDGSYMVSASLKLDDLDDLLDVDLDSEDYDSLGGYIIELLDHLPSEGETAEDEHFLFKVVSVDKNRMETIHIIPKESKSKKRTLLFLARFFFVLSYLKYSTPDSKIF